MDKTLITNEEYRELADRFTKKVNKRSKEEMKQFLCDHYRYYTASSWNMATSYAHCIKIQYILPTDISETHWGMISNDEWCSHMSDLIRVFDDYHDHKWQVGVNGMSGGYLVLYQGSIVKDKIVCYPGRSVDQREDFHEWDMKELRERVSVVCDFDSLALNIAISFVEFCRTYDIVQKTILVEKKIDVLCKKDIK